MTTNTTSAPHVPLRDRIEMNYEPGDSWPYTVWLGSDDTHGWMLECDMKGGGFNAALSSAGQSSLMQISLRERADGNTDAFISVEAGRATWDEETRCLTITNGPEKTAEQRLQEAMSELRYAAEIVATAYLHTDISGPIEALSRMLAEVADIEESIRTEGR